MIIDGKKIRLKDDLPETLNLNNLNMDQLYFKNIFEPTKYLYCANNSLTKLNILLGIRTVCCQKNNIKEIHIPKTCHSIELDHDVIILNYEEIKDTCEISYVR